MMTDPFTAPAQMKGMSLHHITSMRVASLQAHTSRSHLFQRSFYTRVDVDGTRRPNFAFKVLTAIIVLLMLVEDTRIVAAAALLL